VIASACFTASCPGTPGTTGEGPERVEKVLPWAGPVLLSWAGLLGRMEIMATNKHCKDSCAQEQLLCQAQQG